MMVSLKKGFRHINGSRISITNTDQKIARHIMLWDMIMTDFKGNEVYSRLDTYKVGPLTSEFKPSNNDSIALECLKHFLNGSGSFQLNYKNKYFSVTCSKNNKNYFGKGRTLAKAICACLIIISNQRYSS